ncbi:exonuclease [Vibrio phage vB_VpaP_M9]|uniref:Putative exonuclease n=1 Tax=Vibrio phage OWB TaxID=2713205 RepID=A0A6G6XZS1_9CAUD|nr:exonuclease [Vibrio phage vB_VpaS_OWB]QIG66525.1 putative exonuclease [Vibrio phage OWB]USL89764.1 exonuclease [Vibrio phage vB_VpaP_M83]USL89822.1 exonuclease [Vibrio phage vB_VpaP_M9]
MTGIHGLNLDALDDQFAIVDSGKVLILDGDFYLYQAAATVKTLPTAIRRFHSLVLQEMFYSNCQTAEVYCTDSNSPKCLRPLYPTFKPYQANRKGKQKPPLLDMLKQAVQGMKLHEHPDGISVIWAFEEEADDLMIQRGEELYPNGLISSGDKDLRMTRAPYWEQKLAITSEIDNRFGYIKWYEGENMPLKGHGTAFFWAQMLMGDSADNIRGIDRLDGKLCGPTKAYEFLTDLITGSPDDETVVANTIIGKYAAARQDPLAEAEMLWLRRSADDSGYAYLMEVVTVPEYRNWLEQLHTYHMAVIKHKQDNPDEEA